MAPGVKLLKIHFKSKFLKILCLLKCSIKIPACGSGPDHICSDGKCYSQSGCPMGTFLVSNNTCTCSSACNGTSNSYLHVI